MDWLSAVGAVVTTAVYQGISYATANAGKNGEGFNGLKFGRTFVIGVIAAGIGGFAGLSGTIEITIPALATILVNKVWSWVEKSQ